MGNIQRKPQNDENDVRDVAAATTAANITKLYTQFGNK